LILDKDNANVSCSKLRKFLKTNYFSYFEVHIHILHREDGLTQDRTGQGGRERQREREWNGEFSQRALFEYGPYRFLHGVGQRFFFRINFLPPVSG
jgi:hypothetical protein